MREPLHTILRPVIWGAGSLLSALPAGMAGWLLWKTFHMGSFRALCFGGFGDTARRLLLHHLSTPPGNAGFDGVIVIAGVPRVGKSIVARSVAEALKMRVLSTDSLRPVWRAMPVNKQKATKQQLLLDICRQARGLVLEGTHLTQPDERKTGDVGFAFNRSILKRDNIRVFAVGCCQSSQEAWIAALRQDDGWITQRDEDYLQQFAATCRARSEKIRDTALAAGVGYFDVPREDFAAARDRTVAAIVAGVRA